MPAPQLDLGHLLSSLATGALSSRDVDLLELHGGGADEAHKARVAWGSLTRGLTTTPGKDGGYLTQEAVGPAAAALRPASVAVRTGCQVIESADNLALPVITDPISATWLPGELDAASETQPGIGLRLASPRICAAYVESSRQLLRQGPEVSAVLQRELTAAVGTALDAAIFSGSGAAGSPLGLANVTGIGTDSGTDLDYAGVLGAVEAVLDAGADEASLAWIAPPATATILRGRARFSGGGTALLDGGRIADYPAYISGNAPTGTLILADMSRVVLVLFGGLMVEVNPFANHRAGLVGFRLLAMADVVSLYPSTVYTLTSVS